MWTGVDRVALWIMNVDRLSGFVRPHQCVKRHSASDLLTVDRVDHRCGQRSPGVPQRQNTYFRPCTRRRLATVGLSLLLLAFQVYSVGAQYLEGSSLYDYYVQFGKDKLKEEQKVHPFLVDKFFPELRLIPRDYYDVIFPPKTSTVFGAGTDTFINIIFDPCRGNPYDCCDGVYGTPEYTVLENTTWQKQVFQDGTDVIEEESRLQDREVVVDDECTGEEAPFKVYDECHGCLTPPKAKFDPTAIVTPFVDCPDKVKKHCALNTGIYSRGIIDVQIDYSTDMYTNKLNGQRREYQILCREMDSACEHEDIESCDADYFCNWQLRTTDPVRQKENCLVDPEKRNITTCRKINIWRRDCVRPRVALQQSQRRPRCWDNNATLISDQSCTDAKGITRPYCIMFAFSYDALVYQCSGLNGAGPYATDSHCGTFLEIHLPDNGVFTEEEINEVILDIRLPEGIWSGFKSEVMPTQYKKFPERILCEGSYQVWWVQRTLDRFVIEFKTLIYVSSPACDWDPYNKKYVPYKIIDIPT